MEAAPSVRESLCARENDVYCISDKWVLIKIKINGLCEGYPSAVYNFISAYVSSVRHTHTHIQP